MLGLLGSPWSQRCQAPHGTGHAVVPEVLGGSHGCAVVPRVLAVPTEVLWSQGCQWGSRCHGPRSTGVSIVPGVLGSPWSQGRTGAAMGLGSQGAGWARCRVPKGHPRAPSPLPSHTHPLPVPCPQTPGQMPRCVAWQPQVPQAPMQCATAPCGPTCSTCVWCCQTGACSTLPAPGARPGGHRRGWAVPGGGAMWVPTHWPLAGSVRPATT